jgi:hypothetical protein
MAAKSKKPGWWQPGFRFFPLYFQYSWFAEIVGQKRQGSGNRKHESLRLRSGLRQRGAVFGPRLLIPGLKITRRRGLVAGDPDYPGLLQGLAAQDMRFGGAVAVRICSRPLTYYRRSTSPAIVSRLLNRRI